MHFEFVEDDHASSGNQDHNESVSATGQSGGPVVSCEAVPEGRTLAEGTVSDNSGNPMSAP